jgi:signal peptidase I
VGVGFIRPACDTAKSFPEQTEQNAPDFRKRWMMKLIEHIRNVFTTGRRPGPRGFVAEWTITLLLVFFGTTTLVQAYVIPTGSMEGNLLIGDHMLVDRLAYSDPGILGGGLLPYRSIQHGDIIAFRYPLDPSQAYVKRVIGIPGDRIRLENRQVIRNGRRLVEPYTQHIALGSDRYRDNFPQSPPAGLPAPAREMLQSHVSGREVVTPPGMLFVMGDNRENSSDSRYWGFVPRENVIGKPLIVYWSYDAPTEDLVEWNVHHLVDVTLHFFTKTRWERTLLIPRARRAEVD